MQYLYTGGREGRGREGGWEVRREGRERGEEGREGGREGEQRDT